ncbi:MAG: PD-(D/E)XK nuclease family protein [Tepidisphaeraceae bacterium]
MRFILGRAGTGKTQWCFDRILQAIRNQPLGPALYWIVPRQATFLAQRQLACAGGLGGYFRARILDLPDLATEILAECGPIALPEITDRGRRMILGHLLRELQDKLQFFSSVAHQPGLAAELDETFSEMERSGQEAAGIERQLSQTPVSLNPSLRAKIHDLSLIYSRYTQFLGQDRLDPNRRLTDALAAIDRCRSLRDCEVFVDSFYDFTGSERRAIASLAKVCRSLSVTLTIDPQDPCVANPHRIPADTSLFHRSEQAYRRLWFTLQENGVALEPPVLLKEPRRFQNPQLIRLERAFLFSPGSPPEETGEGKPPAIQLIEAPDRRAEVDAAARWIRRLTSAELRYRDIAVLMRAQEDYHQLIEASFREHNIPFFVDRRRTASHHPLLRLIRAALAVAITKWAHEPMMAILKTGLIGLSDAEADALENYVLLHGIHHGTWARPWTGRRRRRTEESGEALTPAPNADSIDALRRRFVERIAPFVLSVSASPRMPVRALASAVFRLLEDFQCRQQIVQWMERAAELHSLEERGEHERVWDELVKLFDELVDLFGDEPIALKDFSTILDSALEGFDLALTPPTVDQVLVGTVDRTRTLAVRACVVLGLSEGQFPLAGREDSVFTDSDRRTLGKSNIDLDPDTARRLLDEKFLGYLAMTRASDRLLVTRSASDDNGSPTAASPLWQRIVERIPNVAINPVPRQEDLPRQLIATPRQLVCGLMRWVRSGADDPSWEPIYQWLAAHAPNDDAIDAIRSRAWKALSYRNDAMLDPERAAALFHSPLNVTARQLESFRMCPYQHFARHGLQLTQRERRQVTGGDLSHIYHEVLERLVSGLIESSQAWQNLDENDAKRRISQLTEKLGRQLREELMLSTARNRYLLGHIEKTLGLVALAQKAAAQRGEFRPAFAGIRFGPTTGDPATDPRLPPLAVRTPAGNDVQLRGKIDRIDLLPDGSACAIDYRLMADRLDPASAFHGLSLQLLICLLVLEKNGHHLSPAGKLTPSAAFCIQLLRSVRGQGPEKSLSPDDPLFHLLVKPRGVFDLRIASKLDKSLTEGQSKVVQLFLKKDGAVGLANTSDAAAADDFAALLRHVERRIGQTADEIIAGRIDIRPYRMGTTTPCSSCEFRALCRLEPSPGCYDDLEPMTRPEMFQRMKEGL